MLGEIGGLVNTALRNKMQEIKNSTAAEGSRLELQKRLNETMLRNLEEVNSDKFNPDQYLESLRKGELASIETGRVRSGAERENLAGMLPIRGEALSQNARYQTGLLDAQTQNEINKMRERAGLVGGYLDKQIDYDKWAKGGSDYDQLQRVLEYAGSENAANRSLREKERNQGLVTNLIGNLLMGASAFFG